MKYDWRISYQLAISIEFYIYFLIDAHDTGVNFLGWLETRIRYYVFSEIAENIWSFFENLNIEILDFIFCV